MFPSSRPLLWLAAGFLLTQSTGFATPPTLRSERIAARAAERAYARQSIAAARAARAEARVAEIAPLVPVPPPPRPATVRRMARAGVPVGGPVIGPPPAAAMLAAPALQAPRALPPVGVESSMPQPVATAAVRPVAPPPAVPQQTTAADVAPDGTRSVLATAESPTTPAVPPREPSGPAVAHPPIELLPTPQPQ